MIPLIGLMIGAYIIARMMASMFKDTKFDELNGLFSVITIVVVFFCLIGLFNSSTQLNSALSDVSFFSNKAEDDIIKVVNPKSELAKEQENENNGSVGDLDKYNAEYQARYEKEAANAKPSEALPDIEVTDNTEELPPLTQP